MSEKEEVYKEKIPDLFKEIIPSLTFTKEHLIDTNVLQENKYPYHVVNNHFSFSSENIFLANEINKHERILTPKQQYDFWFYILEKQKRFDKWVKAEKKSESLSLILEYYGCSVQKAKQYEKILTSSQIQLIKRRLGKEE